MLLLVLAARFGWVLIGAAAYGGAPLLVTLLGFGAYLLGATGTLNWLRDEAAPPAWQPLLMFVGILGPSLWFFAYSGA